MRQTKVTISTLSNFSIAMSKYLTDFYKNHKTQATRLKMIETWCLMLNKGNKVINNLPTLHKLRLIKRLLTEVYKYVNGLSAY